MIEANRIDVYFQKMTIRFTALDKKHRSKFKVTFCI